MTQIKAHIITFAADNNFIFSCSNSYIHGLKTIMKADTKESQKIKLELSAQLEKGHYKIIFIAPDDNVQTLFEDDKIINDEFEFKKGIKQIKIVGKPAQIKSIEAKIKNIDLSKVYILDPEAEIKAQDDLEKSIQ